jgi:hypothetical protein
VAWNPLDDQTKAFQADLADVDTHAVTLGKDIHIAIIVTNCSADMLQDRASCLSVLGISCLVIPALLCCLAMKRRDRARLLQQNNSQKGQAPAAASKPDNEKSGLGPAVNGGLAAPISSALQASSLGAGSSGAGPSVTTAAAGPSSSSAR